MEALIYLNTRTSDGVTNYKTHWNIQDATLTNFDSFTITVKSIEIPNAVYPTNRFNNVFKFTEDGIIFYTITLTPNAYTGTSIAAALQTEMNLVGGWTYTCTYDLSLRVITITAVGGTWTMVLVENAVYESIGMNQNTFSTPALSFTSAYPVHLSGTQYVDLHSNLSNNSYSSTSSHNILARFPLTSGFGNVEYYMNEYHDNLFMSSGHLSTIYLELRDDRGNPWELPDNMHMSLTLAIKQV